MLVGVILDQPEIGLLPGTAVLAPRQTNALVPVLVRTLPQVPHHGLAADPKNRAVVRDPLAVVGARVSQRHHRFVTVTRLLAPQVQLHTVLERNAVVIEGKENDGVETGVGSAVVDAHAYPQ